MLIVIYRLYTALKLHIFIFMTFEYKTLWIRNPQLHSLRLQLSLYLYALCAGTHPYLEHCHCIQGVRSQTPCCIVLLVLKIALSKSSQLQITCMIPLLVVYNII